MIPASSTGRGSTAFRLHALPDDARPWGTAYFNSKFSHLVNQRRPRQSKPVGRSLLSANQPVRLLQCLQDMLPIGFGRACARQSPNAASPSVLKSNGRRNNRSGRKEHCALDEILQLADITRPVVGL